MRVYALTVLLSSFLLFQVQPIVAKAILPWFGGAPAVWTTCMVFFQAVLLAGYAYAHVIVRFLSARRQAAVHIALLAATLLLLPVGADPEWQPEGDENPSLRILGLLAASVGLPYFLLSSTGPLIQAWAGARRAGSPYRLYALSNAGSLAALLSYPFGIEPLLTIDAQFSIWSAGYALFVALSALAALKARGQAVLAATADAPAARPPRARSLALWALLPACASVLLLAVTSQMCQEIAVVPLLWLLPLTLYLLSFILCFESDRWYRRGPTLAALLVLSCAVLGAFTFVPDLGPKVGIPVFALYLFLACMACHGEVARLRPPTAQLTLFYLMISLGGVAGGLFVGLLAPVAFSGYLEFPLGVVITMALLLYAGAGAGAGDRADEWLRFASFLCLVALVTIWIMVPFQGDHRPRVAARNFYGTLRVFESGVAPDRMRVLSHGVTRHGAQFVDPARRREPTSYFGPQSGAGLVLAHFRPDAPRRIGILGLGAGTLAAYARPGDSFRFYEINPLVVELAHREFTFLADAAGRNEMVVADARLALERERGQPKFDVLVADVFSGDAIPVHLLTEEAFLVYRERLSPGGVLAVHISNRGLDLQPVLAAAARTLGYRAVVMDSPSDPARGWSRALWVLMAADPGVLEGLPLSGAKPLAVDREVPWRDNFSNLVQILK